MSETNRRMIFLTEDDVPVAKLKQPPSKCIIPELKRWLECHNEKKKGLKAELVERVERCILLKKKVDPKVDGGKWHQLKAAETVSTPTEQAQTSAQVSVPPLRQGVWKKWPSRNLPRMFNYGHVYRFPVESVSGMIIEDSSGEEGDENEAAEDTTTEKPLRKGDILWKSEFIDDVHDNEDNRDYYVRAHVHHSKKNDLPLAVHITLSKATGYVKKATCSCKARALNRCVHVAAVLLMLDDYVKTNGHIVNEPSTSQPCVCNKGKKRKKNPKALHEAAYNSLLSNKRKKLYHWDPRPLEYRKTCKSLISGLVTDLQVDTANSGKDISMWETLFILNTLILKL